MSKPAMDLKRPLSWSAISSFDYDPAQWYRKYVLGQEDPASEAMTFGKVMGEQLASDPSFLPMIPRAKIYEYELRTSLGKIPLIGFIDSYTEHMQLEEYKTGAKAWTQKRADEHGQIDMYLLMLKLMHGVKPESVACRITWMPTEETGDFKVRFRKGAPIQSFETKRTTIQILRFGQRIQETYKAMQAYAKHHA